MQSYNTRGTCSRQILFDVTEDNKVKNVKFIGGCLGNLQAVARLVDGKDIDEVIKTLKGIRCKGNTSCGDQLALALLDYKDRKNNPQPEKPRRFCSSKTAGQFLRKNLSLYFFNFSLSDFQKQIFKSIFFVIRLPVEFIFTFDFYTIIFAVDVHLLISRQHTAILKTEITVFFISHGLPVIPPVVG